MAPVAGWSIDPRGPVAETINDLWWLMLGLGVAVFVLFMVLLARGLVRPAGAAEADEGARTRRWLVGGGLLMPIVVLVVVFAGTVYAMRAMPTPGGADDELVVEVVGHQWWYEVRYPQHDVTARDEMHVPVGRPFVLRLTSVDVIHSFWVPEFGPKMDMLPEDVNVLVLEADEPGTYHARCAEFCGLHHADMHMVVVAEPEDRFAAWLAQQS